ncbi:MAG: hypothetical protein JXA71_00220 [Chitinispirillaceae bacterium]|nr:hypothetical protein [Chitinispirillaceae bacterium]
MRDEKTFFEELGRVPPLPDGLYGSIERGIGRARRLEQAIIAIAATLIVALGSGAFFLNRAAHDRMVPQEVASELQNVHDYLNGNDLDQELQVYAVYYNEER